jgi:WD40-like Beta Propeller Repeat
MVLPRRAPSRQYAPQCSTAVPSCAIAEQTLEIIYDGSALGQQAELTGIDNITVHPKSGDIFVAEDENRDASLDLGLITADRFASRFLTASGPLHAGSELTGPSFDPSGTRLYISSQRGTGKGVIYEISGPFRQERPTIPVVTPTPSATPSPTPSGGTRPDTRRPAVNVRVLGMGTIKAVRRSGLPLAVRADEDVRLEAVVRRRKRNGSAGRVLARRARALRAGTMVTLKLKLGDGLPHKGTLPIVVSVVATDAAGNSSSVERNLRLR